MTPGLPAPLAAIAPVLDHYGYLAVAGLVMVESFGVPAPAQTLLIVAGIYAGDGRLNVALVALVGFLAAVAGDSIGFWIGRVGGRRLVLGAGHYVGLSAQRLDKAEGFFDRHGGKIVAVARFVDGLRQFNGVVAGVANMRWWKFLAFNALGAILWSALWSGLGYLAGQHINAIYAHVQHYQGYLLAALGLVVALWLARWLRKRHHHHPSPGHGHGHGE
jgi:membrane protein DedA with SNARE-associated domain